MARGVISPGFWSHRQMIAAAQAVQNPAYIGQHVSTAAGPLGGNRKKGCVSKMKYAILSDVHSNYDAFDSVLRRCAEMKIDRYLFLGDLVGYNAEPARCMALAREVEFLAAVRGNHDEYVVSGNTEQAGFNSNATIAIKWTRTQLSDDDMDYLDALPLRATVPDTPITLVHATLDSPETWGYIFDAHHAVASLTYQRTQLCFCGHSHVPVAFDKAPLAVGRKLVERIDTWESNFAYPEADTDFSLADELPVQLEKGHKYLFNIGSIGQPRNGDPRSSFAVYDDEAQTVTRYRQPYDVAAAQEKVRAAGLPERLAFRLGVGH